MKKVPLALIIDDPAPGVSIMHRHRNPPVTTDGRPVSRFIPVSFMREFCDVMERYGIKGKFTVVPCPLNDGDIINGIKDVSKEDLEEWMHLLKTRVMKYFSICPEMITHWLALDLETGKELDMTEKEWAIDKDRAQMAPYIAYALSVLKEAGIDVCGVTSPWDFGIEHEHDYAAAISDAMFEVYGKKNSWYFLRTTSNIEDANGPWVEYDDGDRCTVSTPSTICDRIAEMYDDPRTDDDYINWMIDRYISPDGKTGELVDSINAGYAVMTTHWSSIHTNGTHVGLKVLEGVAKRVNEFYGDRVQWMNFEEIMNMVLADKDNYKKPASLMK